MLMTTERELLNRAASIIADAEEAYGAFDTDHWTENEIQKRWEFWRDYWTVADPMPRDEWPAEYQLDTWKPCVRCGEHHACYACKVVHWIEDDDPNCNPDPSGNEDCDLRAVVADEHPPGFDADARRGNSALEGYGANSPAMMEARAAFRKKERES